MLLLSQKGPRNFLLKYSDPTAQNSKSTNTWRIQNPNSAILAARAISTAAHKVA